MVSVELIARILGTKSAMTARNACLLGGGLSGRRNTCPPSSM